MTKRKLAPHKNQIPYIIKQQYLSRNLQNICIELRRLKTNPVVLPNKLTYGTYRAVVNCALQRNIRKISSCDNPTQIAKTIRTSLLKDFGL